MQQSHRTASIASVLAVLGIGCGGEEAKPTDLAPEGPDVAALSFEEANERFNAKRPALEAIQARFEPEFFALPGAVSIGIGLEDDGETPVFRSVVSDARLTERLPRAIEGVRLDVMVSGDARLLDGGPTCNGGAGPPCHTDQTQYPVEMGNSGAWSLGSACTLGFKACDLSSGLSVAVTNSHCAQYQVGCALAPLGFPVKHVSPADAVVGVPTLDIGNISGHAAPSCGSGFNYLDATKFDSPFFQTTPDTRDIGTPEPEWINPTPGAHVQYSGRSTGRNRGTLIAVNVTVVVPASGGFCCGTLTMRDQLSFDPVYSILPGDSGSGVLSNGKSYAWPRRRVLGLLFAADGNLGYFNNIERIMTELDLTFDFTQCGLPR